VCGVSVAVRKGSSDGSVWCLRYVQTGGQSDGDVVMLQLEDGEAPPAVQISRTVPVAEGERNQNISCYKITTPNRKVPSSAI
jgi:hypothetical protein